MNYKQRITTDYRIMLGKPIIKGTRITVELLLRKLADGYSVMEITEMYPHIEMEAILAAKCYHHSKISKQS
jgi:uncharacterized protein (DUF433 family)